MIKKTRNWKKVNEKYINEGLIYFSMDFVRIWKKELGSMNSGKEGARFRFPESLMRFCAVLKTVFNLGYRQEQGILLAMKHQGLVPAVPYYTQIQRRVVKLGLDIVKSLKSPSDGQIIAIDSSGIKLYNSGEWIREKHKKRKPFIKLHIAVNIETKQAVSVRITEDSIGDNKVAMQLVDDARQIATVAKVLEDGAYDTYKNWNGLNARSIKPVIKLRKNAVVNNKRSKTRSQAVKCSKGIEKEWAKACGYGQRWQSETWFSSFKRRFGEYVYSTKTENVLHEILFKVCLCNELIV